MCYLVISREYFPEPYNPEYREASQRLYDYMKSVNDGFEPVTEHVFADGTYTRVMHLPAGAAIVGKVHHRAGVNILVSGTCQITTDEMEPTLIEAPYWFVSGPNVRKCILAVTDIMFMNVLPNPTNSRDVEAFEQEWASDTYHPTVNQLTLESN